MKRTRMVALAATVLLIMLPTGGCGSDSSDEFREDYNAAVRKLSRINTDIGSAGRGAGGQSNAAIAKEFNQIADTADQTRSELAALDPPEKAMEEFNRLLAALEEGVADLRSVAEAAESDDPQKANRAVERLAQSGREITSAENALKSAVDD